MNKPILLFISLFWLIIAVFSAISLTVSPSEVMMWSVLFVVIAGIPHGAIDHIIFQEENTVSPVQFYVFYFGMMGLYCLLWVLFPFWSLLLFLMISAYHFGESQFSKLSNEFRFDSTILFILWGISILSGLIYYNQEDIISMSPNTSDFTELLPIFDSGIYSYLLPISTFFTVAMLGWFWYRKSFTSERLLMEIYVLAMIHISFYLLPVMLGFALYFVCLHSCKVLGEEFIYLKSRRSKLTVPSFIKLLLPFSILSILGGAVLVYFSFTGFLAISKILLLFILISILTLPHSIVMNRFYKKSN